MGNKNRKTTKLEITHLKKVVVEAFPGYKAIIGSHGDYGGHRAPRDHTISFRLMDSKGKFRSNVVWVMPDSISNLCADDIKKMVSRANGK